MYVRYEIIYGKTEGLRGQGIWYVVIWNNAHWWDARHYGPDAESVHRHVSYFLVAVTKISEGNYLKKRKDFFGGAGAQLGWSCLNAPCAWVKLTEVGIHGRGSSSLPVQNVRRIQGQGPHSPRTHLQSPNFSSYILPSEVSKTSPNSTISLEPIISKQLCYLISTHN